MIANIGEKIASFFKERTEFGVKNSPPLEDLESLSLKYKFSNLLPYETFDSRYSLFFNRNSTGFVIECPPMVGANEEIQREISSIFQNLLPLGSSFQCILWADPYIKSDLDLWKKKREGAGSVLQKLAEKRTDFFSSSSIVLRKFRCILSFSRSRVAENDVTKKELVKLRENIVSTLKNAHIFAWTWDAEDLIQTLDGLINFQNEVGRPKLSWNPYDDISSQISSPEMHFTIEEDAVSLQFGNNKVKTYSVRRYPELWSLYAMGDLIGDQFNALSTIQTPFLLHYGVWFCPEDGIKTKLFAKNSLVEKQVFSPIGKHIPSLQEEYKEINAVLRSLDNGDRLVRSSLNIVLFSPTSELSESERSLMGLFRSKGFEIVPNKYVHLQSFLAALPMTWGDGMNTDLFHHRLLKTTLSKESANLLPLQADWTGTKTPGMPLVSRRGQLFSWHAFDNNTGNYNVCVVGRSGSGKSVFMQELMTSTLGLGGRVFVLDVGRSFEKTCRLLDGQFIEFTTQTNLSLNPFSKLPGNSKEALIDSLAMLKPVLSMMAAPTIGTDDMQNALLEKAILAVWDSKGKEATITDVAEYLNNQNENRSKDLSTMLFPYTKDGAYGRFFEGTSNIDFNSQLVVLELEELKERKDLQSVVIQMIIIQITNQMFLGGRERIFHIVIDEAWDMLRGPQTGAFIDTLARRLRKYNGSLVIGTQSVNDFYISPGALAAFENSDWMCLLSQKKESIDQLKKSERISLDPHMEAVLKSVHTKHGEYAEIMISGPDGYSVGRLILDPFSQMLYSTKASEYSDIKSLQVKGLSLEDAIETVALNRNA
jgi:conjugal transfer ATP-binding protein TraC